MNCLPLGGYVMYLLPMFLGRTYDFQKNTAGIDIYDSADIAKARVQDATRTYSNYMQASNLNSFEDRRGYLEVPRNFALKIPAGLLNAKGFGDYLEHVHQEDKSVRIASKIVSLSHHEYINFKAVPLDFWHHLDNKLVGTHVVDSLTYGGFMYFFIDVIPYKAEDLVKIRVEMQHLLDANHENRYSFLRYTEDELESLSKNISNIAKIEIDYFATLPLDRVPVSLVGLKRLVENFKNRTLSFNNGKGVPIVAKLTPLSMLKGSIQFTKKCLLSDVDLAAFTDKFIYLKEAKSDLKDLISLLPEDVPEHYIEEVANLYEKLTSVLNHFHEAIGNLDIYKGREQFESALTAYYNDSDKGILKGLYKAKVIMLKRKMPQKDKPRGIYTQWGKNSCENKRSNTLYSGFMSSFKATGAGSRTDYLCLPNNPDMHSGFQPVHEDGSSQLTAVRYKSLSFYPDTISKNGIAPCSVCESVLRSSVKMFPASKSCPDFWTEEYSGFLVSNSKVGGTTEFICLDKDPKYYDLQNYNSQNDAIHSIVLPVKIGNEGLDAKSFKKGTPVPCIVCSRLL